MKNLYTYLFTVLSFFLLHPLMAEDAGGGTYCEAKGKSNSYGWIKKVQINDVAISSGWSSKGYADYSSHIAKACHGDEVSLVLKPYFTGHHSHHYGPQKAQWRVFIDFNHDGKFKSDEMVVNTSSWNDIHHKFKVPNNAKLGKARVRVIVRWVYQPQACGWFWYGEVEDYTLDICEKKDDDHEPTYCDAKGKSPYYGYIKYVRIGDHIKHSSWYAKHGYEDNTDDCAEVKPGDKLKLYLHPYLVNHYGYVWKAYWRVWADWDQDGKFEDSERLVNKGSFYNIHEWVKVPSNAKPGKVRIRVAVRFKNSPVDCGWYSYGEVEDYCIKVKGDDHDPGSHYCSASTKSSHYGYIKGVQYGKINHWSSYGKHGYGYYSKWKTTCYRGYKHGLKLYPSISSYGWYKKSPYWVVYIDFDHDGKFESHEKVLRYISKYNIHDWVSIPWYAKKGWTRMRVTVNWDYEPKGCDHYSYGEVEDYPIYITDYSGSNSEVFNSGEMIATKDEAPAPLIVMDEPAGHNSLKDLPFADEVSRSVASVAVYPNPASEEISVNWNTNSAEIAAIKIHNVGGQIVHEVAAPPAEGQQLIDVTGWTSGVYMIRLIDANGQDLKVERVIVQH